MMSIRLACFILSWYLIICVCPDSVQNNSIKIGDTVIICITMFGSAGQETQMSMSVTVDTYAALKPSGMYEKLTTTAESKSLRIQYADIASDSNKYVQNHTASDSKIKIADFYSVVVRVNAGKIEKFQFSNEKLCSSLGYSDCLRQVDKTRPSTENYDPKIFISWIGTDSDGRYMLSHTKRLERFTQYSIESASLMDQVKNVFK